jgi:anti-sigma factor RsiW
MTDPQSEARAFLLQAAADGELDAAGMIEVEAELAADPALAAEYARLVALREAIGARAPRPRAPDALRARILAMAEAPDRRPVVAPRRPIARLSSYARLAASLVLGIAVGAGAFSVLAPPRGGDDVEGAIVAGFVRGRLAGDPVDVATSDRHTVKPWFAGKIAGATTVVDLKADGFPLVGGRVDVVGATPVATLIYQRREHQIALSEMPARGAEAPGELRRATRAGYSIVEWTDGGRLFAAVSDLPPAELDAFAAAFRRAAAAEREDAPKP